MEARSRQVEVQQFPRLTYQGFEPKIQPPKVIALGWTPPQIQQPQVAVPKLSSSKRIFKKKKALKKIEQESDEDSEQQESDAEPEDQSKAFRGNDHDHDGNDGDGIAA